MIRTMLAKFRHGQTWGERNFVWLLVAGVAVFMALTIAIGAWQSVWFDEAYSILLARQPAAQVVHLTSLDTHPPLYYLLLKGWAALFGYGELALRSLSVLTAGGAVLFAGLTARRMFGARVALMALPFVVFAPFLLRYGFEIRMYALASLIGMAATYVLVRAWQTQLEGDRRALWLLYAVLVALGVYTLYYMALIWVTHALWLFWMARREKRPIIKAPWLRAYGVSVLLFLPWLPAFVSQLGNGALAAISQPMTIDNLVGVVSFEFVYRPVWQLGAFLSLVVVGVIVALVCAISRAFRNVAKNQYVYLVLLAMYMAVPVAIVTIVSLVRPLYVERYLAHEAIGGMLFVGVCVALANLRRWRLMVSVGLIAVLIMGVAQLAVVGNYNFQRLQSPQLADAAKVMLPCDTSVTVFAADPYVAIELMYYLPDCQVYFYSDTVQLGGGYAPLSNSPLHVSDPQKELATSSAIYYVYYGKSNLNLPKNMTLKHVYDYDTLHVAMYAQ